VDYFQAMSFRPGPGPTGTRNVAPKGYVAGLGRGAAGFTTRSDIGPLNSSGGETVTDGSGSRAAEMRAAKLQMKNLQQQNQNSTNLLVTNPFGLAPQGYVAGEYILDKTWSCVGETPRRISSGNALNASFTNHSE
jgi:hypothetical protein